MEVDGQLSLVRVDADHWLVHDHRYPETDARRVIACVAESEDELEVVWLVADIPLPTRYRVGGDILEDLLRWRGQVHPGTRPVEITGLPPFALH